MKWLFAIIVLCLVGGIMAVEGQTTDKLSTDTSPQTQRVLLEGTVNFTPDDYSDSGALYVANKTVDITELNDLGNRIKGFNPQTLDVQVWRFHKLTPGGEVNDYYYKLPKITFDAVTGSVSEVSTFEIENVYIIADQTNASYLTIYDYKASAPTRDYNFAYKVYSTIVEFEDVD